MLGALFLVKCRPRFFVSAWAGDPRSHKNYWGGDLGTGLLLAILVMATHADFYLAWKPWPGHRRR